jgi:hypothetical protein
MMMKVKVTMMMIMSMMMMRLFFFKNPHAEEAHEGNDECHQTSMNGSVQTSQAVIAAVTVTAPQGKAVTATSRLSARFRCRRAPSCIAAFSLKRCPERIGHCGFCRAGVRS